MRRSSAEQLTIESRRSQVASLFLQGTKRQGELAQKLGVDRSTISRDLKVLQDRWKEAGVRDLDVAKGQELERIDQLEREYWLAWERSKNSHETTTTEQTTAPGGDRTRAAIRKEEQHGDPRYLAGVQWCVEQRCKILGLHAPTESRLTGPGGSNVAIDVFHKVEQYALILEARHEQRLLPAAGPVRGDGAGEPVAPAAADRPPGGIPAAG
jgi:hypothetical protein